MAGEEFSRLNILTGTAKKLEQKPLTARDEEVFSRDFDMLVHKLAKVDEELGANLGAEKEFYVGVCQIAKGYFDMIPFGGLTCAIGQFGMNFISPQYLDSNATGTKKQYSWFQTLSLTSGVTTADFLGGPTGSTQCYAEATIQERTVLGFHTLISYSPDPQLQLIRINVNDYPYVPFNVEPFAKITKPDKLFKLIPLPGRIVINPGGKFYISGYFDKGTGTSTPGATPSTLDIEIAPFGLIFAEYGKLAAANLL